MKRQALKEQTLTLKQRTGKWEKGRKLMNNKNIQ